MFREKIKVFDCTMRDGGLINNHKFDVRFVRAVYRALSEAGVDYMEIGYKNSKKLFSEKEYGRWKFCDDDDIRRETEDIESKTRISVMVDVGRVDVDEVSERKDSPVHMMRVASYVKDIDKAIFLVNHFAEKGYETTVNIMAISRALDNELTEALHQLEEESRAIVVYVVDSFGALYQETTEFLVKKAKSILKTKEIGMHAHNNQQLAFANTIEAIIHDANYLDGTVYGLGRAAGNCPLELLIGFPRNFVRVTKLADLKDSSLRSFSGIGKCFILSYTMKNPKFDIRPILELISKEFIPLRNNIEWGYIIPYAITGMLDEHPKAAMELRSGDRKEDYREFYESLAGTDLD